MTAEAAADGVVAVVEWLLRHTASPVLVTLLLPRESAAARSRREAALGAGALRGGLLGSWRGGGGGRNGSSAAAAARLGTTAGALAALPLARAASIAPHLDFSKSIGAANGRIADAVRALAARAPGRVRAVDCGAVMRACAATAGLAGAGLGAAAGAAGAEGVPTAARCPSDAPLSRALMPDGLHPGAQGHRVLLRCLRPHLLALKAGAPTVSTPTRAGEAAAG